MKCFLLVDGPGVQLRQPRGAALRRVWKDDCLIFENAWMNEFLLKILYSLQNTLKVVVVKWILSTKKENWNPLWKLEIAETEII